MKVKLNLSSMKFISVFETVTNTFVKDCFEQNGRIVFVVKEGMAGKAIGKEGRNIKRLEEMFKKKVRIIEHSEELAQFVKNAVYPAKVKEIAESDGIVTITPADFENRGLLIGSGAGRLRASEEVVKRFFPIKEIKVV